MYTTVKYYFILFSYISCTVACPYDGDVNPTQVAEVFLYLFVCLFVCFVYECLHSKASLILIILLSMSNLSFFLKNLQRSLWSITEFFVKLKFPDTKFFPISLLLCFSFLCIRLQTLLERDGML